MKFSNNGDDINIMKKVIQEKKNEISKTMRIEE